MIKHFPIKRIVKSAVVLLTLIVTSYLNYCFAQAFVRYFLPATVIPIFCSAVFGYAIPITFIIFIGLVDDIFSNSGIFCLYPMIYLAVDYIAISRFGNIHNKNYLVFAFLILFLLINILTSADY